MVSLHFPVISVFSLCLCVSAVGFEAKWNVLLELIDPARITL